ncbi:hypothetical protein Peur_016033 [Populus x canadensis]
MKTAGATRSGLSSSPLPPCIGGDLQKQQNPQQPIDFSFLFPLFRFVKSASICLDLLCCRSVSFARLLLPCSCSMYWRRQGGTGRDRLAEERWGCWMEEPGMLVVFLRCCCSWCGGDRRGRRSVEIGELEWLRAGVDDRLWWRKK